MAKPYDEKDLKSEQLKLEQITLGFQKWCARYIAECGSNQNFPNPQQNKKAAENMSNRFGKYKKKLLLYLQLKQIKLEK